MPELALDGVRLHHRTTGDGPPVVLVHGSAVDASTWDGVVPALAQDHRVVVYDRRGYGASAHRPVRDHRLHGRDLVAVLEQVVGGPATVVGWSSGGNVALAVAAARPDLVRHLVVVEAPWHGLRHADAAVLRTLVRLKALQLRGRRVEALEQFLRFGSALSGGGSSYDLAPPQEQERLRAYPGPVLAEWDPHPFGIMHEHVPTRRVAALPRPMTWVLGGDSLPWMARLHDRVARRRPDLETVVVPGAGHLVHVDRPEAFVEVVRAAAGRSVRSA